MMEIWILASLAGVSICLAIHYNMQYSLHREQVLRLQAQVRECRESEREGRMTLCIEGLWPDLDEKERLRERVRELEAK